MSIVREKILNEFLHQNNHPDDEILEVFTQALFARDDNDEFVTNNLAQTISLAEKLQ